MTERSEAEKIRMDCDHNSAFVRSVEKQVKTIQPPRLYDLTTLQTYTLREREVYLEGSHENKVWRFYQEHTNDPVLAWDGMDKLIRGFANIS